MYDYILFENHFGVSDNEIRSITRNNIGENLTFIINEIADTLYPDIGIEILFLPSKPGSYKDIFKIISKHPLGTFNILTAIGTLVFTGLSRHDTHQEYLHNNKMYTIDDTMKCIDFKNKLFELEKKGIEVENLPDDKIKEVCGNIKLKKRKNEIIHTLKDDDMIQYNEFILSDNKGNIIKKHKIYRDDFYKYIELIPKIDEKDLKDLKGFIEIISPVVKQTKEGKGIPWKGIYYGDNIKDHGLDVLINGERIEFYMQDNAFKNKIYNHEITFGEGDVIEVLFNIKYNIKKDIIYHKHIYVKYVSKYCNEPGTNFLNYKNKIKKQGNRSIRQLPLF